MTNFKHLQKVGAALTLVIPSLFGCSPAYFGETTDVENYFEVPWPSDTRTVNPTNEGIFAGGRFWARWYANIKPYIPNPNTMTEADVAKFIAGNAMYYQGVEDLPEQKYGTNSAVYFTFFHDVCNAAADPGCDNKIYKGTDKELDLPETLTFQDAQTQYSPIMLVNIKEGSPRYGERIPVQTDFKAPGTLHRAANTLAIRPYPGFTLEKDSLYAAIVFDDLKIKNTSPAQFVEATPFFANKIKDSYNVFTSLLTTEQYGLWQQHRNKVSALLSDENVGVTGDNKDISNVIAFTVYSTQTPDKTLLTVRDGIQAWDDDNIKSLVTSVGILPGESCTSSNSVIAEGTIKMPRWQTVGNNVVYNYLGLGDFPYTLGGGVINVDKNNNGVFDIPTASENIESVTFRARVPCHTPAVSYMINQSGSFSTAASAANGYSNHLWRYNAYNGTALDYDLLTIAVGDAITGRDRRTQAILNDLTVLAAQSPQIDSILKQGGSTVTLAGQDGVIGNLRNNYFNPAAFRGNSIQAAAESLILKRVAENLADLLAEEYATDPLDSWASAEAALQALHQLPLGNVQVDASMPFGYMGYSAGAVNGPLALTMMSDPSNNDHVDFAYFGAGNGTTAPTVVDMEAADFLLNWVFSGLEENEIDVFHPIPNMIETLLGEHDSVNYIDHLQTQNLLATSGTLDSRTVWGSAEALGVSLAKHDLARSTGYFDGVFNGGVDVVSLVPTPGIETILQLEAAPFPVSGNLPNGNTGIFTAYEGGHWGWHFCGMVGEFLFTSSRGGVASMNEGCPTSDSNPPEYIVP